jgi:hypothetical protein
LFQGSAQNANLLKHSTEAIMNIKTNLRAGAGGASGVGKNQTSSTTATPTVVYNVGPYVPLAVGRCTGI